MTTVDEAAVRLDRDGATARITLHRPERHNALRAVDIAAFRAALDEIEGDPALRVLTVTGAGDRTFCAGASLEEMESGVMSGAVFDTLTDRLAHLSLPTVCALNGSVYGGGAELALCCDFRIGGPEMRLSVPAARLGVCYPVGGLGRYARRLGLAAASRILLAAEEMDGEELHRIGFLTHLVASADVLPQAQSLALRLAVLAPLAIQGMKRILLDVTEDTLDQERARRLIERAASSEDLREGLRATREGREPDFRGS